MPPHAFLLHRALPPPEPAEEHVTREVPSLVALCARAIVKLPFDVLKSDKHRAPIHAAIATTLIVPNLPFLVLNKLYYAAPTVLFGNSITTEVHAISLRRFTASRFGHEGGSVGRYQSTLVPVFGVLGKSPPFDTMRERCEFEKSGLMLWDGLTKARTILPETWNCAETALFEIVAHGLLCAADFVGRTDIMIAGGAVVAALTMDPNDEAQRSEYATSDIDVFVSSPGSDIIRSLIQTTIANYKKRSGKEDAAYLIVGTKVFDRDECKYVEPNVVTCFFEHGFPIVQIIGTTSTGEAILNMFDVDCCAVAYTNGAFRAAPKAVRALTHGYNIFDPDLCQGGRGVKRLSKYAHRGFPVFVLRDPATAQCYGGRPEDVLDNFVKRYTVARAAVDVDVAGARADVDSKAYAAPKPPDGFLGHIDQLESFYRQCAGFTAVRDFSTLRFAAEPHSPFRECPNWVPCTTYNPVHPLLSPFYKPCRDPFAHRVTGQVDRSLRAAVELRNRLERAAAESSLRTTTQTKLTNIFSRVR